MATETCDMSPVRINAICAIRGYRFRRPAFRELSSFFLAYTSMLYTSYKRLGSINVTLPEGCPNKKRLPRDAEQLDRYSKDSQRRLAPPWVIQFPLRNTVERGCS